MCSERGQGNRLTSFDLPTNNDYSKTIVSSRMEKGPSTQAIGIRIPRQRAIGVKKEAAIRNVRLLNELFVEMWDLYRRANQDMQKKTRK